jgi:hypothetical protein
MCTRCYGQVASQAFHTSWLAIFSTPSCVNASSFKMVFHLAPVTGREQHGGGRFDALHGTAGSNLAGLHLLKNVSEVPRGSLSSFFPIRTVLKKHQRPFSLLETLRTIRLQTRNNSAMACARRNNFRFPAR